MQPRKASIKETGEELSPTDWERFDDAVAALEAERARVDGVANGEKPERRAQDEETRR